MEKSANGSLLNKLTCVRCISGMMPDERKEKCIMCPLTMLNCTCSIETNDYFPGIGCYKKDTVSPITKNNDIYEISYNFESIFSKLLYDKLLYAVYKCKVIIYL